MDLDLSSNSLVNDGRYMGVTHAGLTPVFEPHRIVEDAAHAVEEVAEIEHRVNHGAHILLATTGQLSSTARLAMELHDAGARVSLIAPKNHPAWALDLLANRMIYRAVAPRKCLESALLRLRPDLVIPCDERTVRDLHRICKTTQDPVVSRLIENSTAPAECFPTIISRAALLSLAQLQGVRIPAFAALSDIKALDGWIKANPAPFVLKADGSWAGFGVRIISNAATAKDAFAKMAQPISGRLAFRESLMERSHFEIRSWLRRDRPAISVQGYVDGWPANVGVACWQGEVLAAVCAEAVATTSATGPSTVARIIDNPEMVDAAKRIVMALGLSGMIGFDFMIEAATGAAYLIEMNPRNTPICAIRLGSGRDLAEALVARIVGRRQRERSPCTEREIVAFFPDTWREDPASHFLHSEYHDVPWEQPELVRVLMLPERRDRHGPLRLLRRLWRAVNGGRETSAR
jgi:ATP-grasp domain-containing protein